MIAVSETIGRAMSNGRDPTGNGQAGDSTVVACVVFQTRDPEQLIQLLQQALTGIADRGPADLGPSPTLTLSRNSEDPWLKHTEAARYLGISISTLYRYACQQIIESRKIGGRLEYHQSALEEFKGRQIRPTRHSRTRGTIVPTLGSGN